MQPRGHALLIGMGGSGRKSLTQLAAFMCDLSVVQIELRKGYDAGCWRDDLKKLHVTAGQGGTSASGEGGTKCAFLLSDSQLTLPSMLDDINTLLNTGDYFLP
jgi:dynein heavy chain